MVTASFGVNVDGKGVVSHGSKFWENFMVAECVSADIFECLTLRRSETALFGSTSLWYRGSFAMELCSYSFKGGENSSKRDGSKNLVRLVRLSATRG